MSTFNVNKSVLEKRDHKLLSVLKSSQVTQILSQAQRCRSSQWQKKDPDNLLQQPREEGERMRFMSSADKASELLLEVSGSAQDSGARIQVQYKEEQSDMQLTV